MSWNDLTLNPKVLLGYFKKAPSLANIEMHRLTFLRDGPTVELVFDTEAFPENPSSKWPVGANRCQLTIRLIGVTNAQVAKWGTGVVGTLNLTTVSNGVRVSFGGEGEFSIVGSHAEVISINGYVGG